MRHEVRFTKEKIGRLLALIEPLAHRLSEPVPPFRLRWLDGPEQEPPVGADVDDSAWPTIEPYTHWGERNRNFVLRTTFTVPAGWGTEGIALHLPIGDAGDFSHPEELAFIDGEPWAACDRHHGEIMLPARWCDGEGHLLALHGWTGISGDLAEPPDRSRIMMNPCTVVLIDEPTREFTAAARTAYDAAGALDADDPAKSRLLTALNDAFTA
ncbi:MAG: alpha-mannosidase, partial [Candidatus Latescibacteria bacterium]|nr:alpha-mannosidase [Candidatus Latescibacterota bacterium]